MIDPLVWLAEQKLYPKVYWQERDTNKVIATAGSRLTLNQLPKHIEKGHRFFGGMSFSNSSKDSLWNAFPKSFFFLPEKELIQENHQTTLYTNQVLKILSRSDCPDFSIWEENLSQSLANLELEKIVLARRSSFQLADPLDPFAILDYLRRLKQKATVFAIQMSPSQTFLGATPEKLYARSGREIKTEAVAGTRPLGPLMREELLRSKKERHEFSCVKKFILSTLNPFCEMLLEEPEDTILETATVQHLYNRITGQLHTSINDIDLIQALHPTPAMGGLPKEKALKSIETLEPFDRGWYASPIGWFSQEKADVAVAIRSALLSDHHMHLFAGTGIVAGSDPKKEWSELEHKISQFRKLFP